MTVNDRDILHFISEHPELDKLLDELATEVSLKTIKWRHDKKAAKIHTIGTMHDKGLHGDHDGIKKFLKNNLAVWRLKGMF
jgi:hypothetical protein